MKTVFIQTHDLARNLCPEGYTCHQLEEYLCHLCQVYPLYRDMGKPAHIVMEMLFKEQKEPRKFDSSYFHVLENIIDVHNVEGEPCYSPCTNIISFSQ